MYTLCLVEKVEKKPDVRLFFFFCLGVFTLQQHNEIMKIMFSYSLFLRCELHFDRMFFHFLNGTLRTLWTFHYG